MKMIVIDNAQFPYEMGKRIAKLKYGDTCGIKGLEKEWEEIIPACFNDVIQIENARLRSIGLSYIPSEDIVKNNEMVLLSEEEWLGHSYKLYKIILKGIGLLGRNLLCYYVVYKDSSTERIYYHPVNPSSIFYTNNDYYIGEFEEHITAIQAIAWTYSTRVSKGGIKEIRRQGDTIYYILNDDATLLQTPRHLTEKEYKQYLTLQT